jgi:3-hydroxybutyryl-CoA dehydrogenase
MNLKEKPVLLKGDNNHACSIAVCLLNAGHSVVFYTDKKDARQVIDAHLSDQKAIFPQNGQKQRLRLTNEAADAFDSPLAIIVTPEDEDIKLSAIRHVQSLLRSHAVIAINTESIPLSKLQRGAQDAGRIVGLNWTEPAHTTFFLEIISNDSTTEGVADQLAAFARECWNKDPYVLTHDVPVRSRMIAAMVREAFYLLENGYVSVEDIDRACRNDPGYYLPFAGHCRYMDLMGTFVYGKVMEDLNPELSKDTALPEFFKEIMRSGGQGIQNGKGFYTYAAGEGQELAEEFRKFSFEIREIIARYPFQYQAQKSLSGRKIPSDV